MKPAEIRIFLEKYAAGEHTLAQHQQFIEWLKTAHISEVEHIAEEYYQLSQKQQSTPEGADVNVIFQIEKALDQYELGNRESKKVKKGFFTWWIMYRSAAAILILSLACYWVYTLQLKKDKPVVVAVPASQPETNEVLPGSNKAMLTLGDGSLISLDDARNGEVASQGGTQISKLANGQVVYNAAVKADEILFNTLTTPRGGQFKLTLPDGSNVWLNSSSSIRYPTAFAGKERKVQVTGEAYFEIAHDASKPFLVSVNDMDIRVLGTHFNVNAYNDEAAVKTTLLQGSVSLSKAGIATLLRPGQQAQLGSAGNFKLVDDVDVDEVVAWKNGYFSFTKADLQTVMRQIARWYDVDITYEGAVPDRQFGGKIGRNSNISEVLKILQETKVNFRIVGKKIIVTP
jgi:transmembrane sensor